MPDQLKETTYMLAKNLVKGIGVGLVVMTLWALLIYPAHCQTAKTGAGNVFSQGSLSSGTVTSVATGNGLQGGTITTTGTIDLRLNSGGGLSKTLGGGSNELGIAAGAITNTMLAGSITAAKLVGTDITTVGTITAGTWTGTTIAFANGGTGLAAAADDTAMVSSGSAWVATAIPNCTDTGGNHLNYTAATNTFSCGTSASGGSGANPAGSGTELQVRLNGTTFGVVTGSSFSGGVLNLGTATRLDITPSSTSSIGQIINMPTSTTQAALLARVGGTTFFEINGARQVINFKSRNLDGTESDGDFTLNNDQKTWLGHYSGRDWYLPSVMFTSVLTLTNTSPTTESTLVGSTGIGSKTIPANYSVIGKTYCVQGKGTLSSSSSPTIFTVRGKFGSVVVVTSAAITPPASLSNEVIEIEGCFPVRASGAAGTVYGQGMVKFTDGAGGIKAYPLAMTAASSTIDWTTTNSLDWTIQYNAITAGNSTTFTTWVYNVYN
jgi:hypothetical protein